MRARAMIGAAAALVGALVSTIIAGCMCDCSPYRFELRPGLYEISSTSVPWLEGAQVTADADRFTLQYEAGGQVYVVTYVRSAAPTHVELRGRGGDRRSPGEVVDRAGSARAGRGEQLPQRQSWATATSPWITATSL